MLALLCGTSYVVSPDCDRIGLRLVGDPLPLARTDELPSEGMVRGAVQAPPDGRPVVFLAYSGEMRWRTRAGARPMSASSFCCCRSWASRSISNPAR